MGKKKNERSVNFFNFGPFSCDRQFIYILQFNNDIMLTLIVMNNMRKELVMIITHY